MGYYDIQGIWRQGDAPKTYIGPNGTSSTESGAGINPQYGVANPVATPVDYSMRAVDRLRANIPTPVTPAPTMPGSTAGISDAEVLALEQKGYREGDVVPGRGILLPDGTFRQTSSTSGSTIVTPPAPTSVGGLQAVTGYTPDEQAALDEYNLRLKNEANQVIDPNAIYQQNLLQRQSEIDSINAMYADLLNQARVRGQGRIESRQFAQGRAGQIGSGTGEAGINSVQDANTEEQVAIYNQKQAALSNIYSKIKDYTREDIAAKETAKKSSAADYVAFLKSEPERRAKNVAASVKLALQNNLTSISQEDLTKIAKELNVTPEVIAAEFKKQVAEKEAEVASTEAEATKSEAELRYKNAQSGKLEAETEQVGKMTPYQAAQLEIEREKMNKAPVTEQATKRDAVNAMSAVVKEAALEDPNGWLTPNQYKNLKEQWVSQTGYEPESFDAYFSDRAYTDQQDKTSPYTYASYGISGSAIKKKTGALPVGK